MNSRLDDLLQKHFHFTHFRPGQREIIEAVLKGNDVLGVLPTGSGKSLCYLLPSLILPYPTVVVSPLISLMIDQVKETKAFHMKEVVALHSLLSFDEREKILSRLQDYKVVYLSPELLQNERILARLQSVQVSLFVVDEAHCISQWGYDFRPDYLRLKQAIRALNNPTVLALSGTVTPDIAEDIILELDREGMQLFHYDTERKNIALHIERLTVPGEKDERLYEILSTYSVPTIIYFSSRRQAELVAQSLQKKLPDRRVSYYHAELEPNSRLKIQQQFIYDQLDIICATSAFGMGINKPNVRLVIHYHLPSQLEAFIQEIGRAGRDGKESLSVLLYEPGDDILPLRLIDQELPTEKQVRAFLNFLYVLHKKGRKLQAPADDLAQQLQIDETIVRLLLYQVERYRLVDQSYIVYDSSHWKVSLEQILNDIESRRGKKREKFREMLQYVHTDRCLRVELYRHFQSKVDSLEENCCSNCGLSSINLTEERNQELVLPVADWKNELARVLGIGELR